jgi:hypothetical protein
MRKITQSLSLTVSIIYYGVCECYYDLQINLFTYFEKKIIKQLHFGIFKCLSCD